MKRLTLGSSLALSLLAAVRIACSPTLALNAGVCFRRDRFIVTAPFVG
jgi:hypothetical protein